ncbi:EAL domain-containing protein [Pelagibius marinus]|uniref:EAL domain-containing protein n=1 Tax=Pelagibius marinus TaxID=2762760 RepID=UPI0018726AA7|nr:EAL domain-containing protein [Pelagibius marinus]
MVQAKEIRNVELVLSEAEQLREQRDRFLAFAFAASDLLLEVGDDSLIRYAVGATNQLLGGSPQEVVGQGWLDLFVEEDRPLLVSKIGNLTPGKRCGPVLVSVRPAKRELGDGKRRLPPTIKVVFSACRIPDHEDVIYCTITVANIPQAKSARATAQRSDNGLLNRAAFEEAATETLEAARAAGQDVEITFIEFVGAAGFRERLGGERWKAFYADAGNVLREGAVDADSAGAIADNRFGFVHQAGAAIGSEVRRQLAELARAFDPTGSGLNVEQATVAASAEELTSEEAAQALVYTINKVAAQGTANLAADNLAASFHEQVMETQDRIAAFKAVVAGNRFDFAFQPIVDLENREISHFEALTRFAHGESPYQTIVFAEDVGLIQEFDMACCRRAIAFMAERAESSPINLAVNLSGLSLQNDIFVEALMELLRPHANLAGRLMFEATESSRMHDLERVSRVFIAMKKQGFSMCLDDFGAGAASFQYLRALEVDYVKIDGTYTRRLLSSDRDSLMLRNLCDLCADLNIKTIAEMVELDDQVGKLRSLGVHLGQGYLLGQPAPQPVFSGPPARARQASGD